jgi:hypothetical protein
MNDAVQIFGLDEVQERAAMAAPGVRMINIYQGHIKESGGRNILTLSIKRDDTGNFPPAQLQYVQRLRGNFTAVLLPTKEYFYITSSAAMNGGGQFNFLPYELEPQAQDPGVLLEKILQLQTENLELKALNKELQQDLAELETGADKFSFALEKLFYRIAPAFGIMDNPTKKTNPMNGQPQNEFQTIDLSGDDEQTIENALTVLLMSFGEDNILKFARRIQQNPNLVNTLIPML